MDNIKFKSKNCISLTSEHNKYLLTSNILLYQQIGSESVFGIVFKAKNINIEFKSIPKFVVKLQLRSEESNKELKIFKLISKYAISNNILHFPLYYFDTTCDNIIKEPEYPVLLQNAKKNNKYYNMLLYECADGDLKSFIKISNYDEKIWKNIYEQIFISIFIFHNLGYYHFDTHLGNFLYKKIKKGGCFHYRINNEDYYIENLGILWMIWDYGNAVLSEKQAKPYMFKDFFRVNLLLSQRNKELEENPVWIKSFFYEKDFPYFGSSLMNDITIPPNIKKLQMKLWEKFINITPGKYLIMESLNNKDFNTKTFIKLLCDEKILFSRTPIGEVINSNIFY